MLTFPVAAMIAASVIATSSTGGNVAAPGVVIRTGDSYASSNVTVVSSGQGSSTIDIRTNVNGRMREEHREVSSNGARVEVSVTATSGPDIEVRVTPPATSTVDGTAWIKKLFGWPSKPVATTTASSSETHSDRASAGVFVRISSWFKGFWSLFR